MDLSIFEAKALAHALTAAGHSVSERTVQRWKKGTTNPKPQDLHAIRLLITKQAAPPNWERRLQRLEETAIRLERAAMRLESRADAWRRSVDDAVEDAERPGEIHLPHTRTRGPKSTPDDEA